MRFAVLIQGVLRGMGRQAACELLATKTVVPALGVPVYSHCAIIEAPADLPDGEYEVEFAGEVAWTERKEGNWVVGQILPHTAAQMTAFIQDERESGHGNSPQRLDRSRKAQSGGASQSVQQQKQD